MILTKLLAFFDYIDSPGTLSKAMNVSIERSSLDNARWPFILLKIGTWPRQQVQKLDFYSISSRLLNNVFPPYYLLLSNPLKSKPYVEIARN